MVICELIILGKCIAMTTIAKKVITIATIGIVAIGSVLSIYNFSDKFNEYNVNECNICMENKKLISICEYSNLHLSCIDCRNMCDKCPYCRSKF